MSKILEMLLKRNKDLNTKQLENETVIESETFSTGDYVNIVSADENLIALPIGKYDLMNNEILVVKEVGIIHSIGKKQKESEIIKALNKRQKKSDRT